MKLGPVARLHYRHDLYTTVALKALWARCDPNSKAAGHITEELERRGYRYDPALRRWLYREQAA